MEELLCETMAINQICHGGFPLDVVRDIDFVDYEIVRKEIERVKREQKEQSNE